MVRGTNNKETYCIRKRGTMGWKFTTQGEDAELFSGDAPDSLHFNRTNIIGVPGHPNGYTLPS